MYCGHVAFGLAARGVRPRIPFYLLLIATFGPDWVELICIAIGLTPTALFSHSIPSVLIGAALLGVMSGLYLRSRQDGLLIAAVYLTHPLVDYLTGYKPLGFGGRFLGARLYDYPLVDWGLESAFLVLGWLIYGRSLPPDNRRQRVLAYSLILILVLLQGIYDRFFSHG